MSNLRSLSRTALFKVSLFSHLKIYKYFKRKLNFSNCSNKFYNAKKIKIFKKTEVSYQRRRFFCQKSAKVLNNVVSCPWGEVNIPNMLFHEAVTCNWSLWERKVAVECASTGRKVKYRDLLKFQKILAASLQNKLKLKKGECIGLAMLNSVELPLIVLACSMCGIVPSPSNPAQTIDELKRHFMDCHIKAIFTNPQTYTKCTGVVAAMGVNIPVVVAKVADETNMPEGAIDFNDLLDPNSAGNFVCPYISLDDTVVLPYSSGTIGLPKGVILSHRNLVSNLVQMAHPQSTVTNPTTVFNQDIVFGILPMYHIYGLMVITFNSLREGTKLLVLPKFDAPLFVRTIVRKKARILHVVPPLVQFLTIDKVKARYLRNIELIVNAASPLPEKFAYKLLEKGKHIKIAQGYGMTETSPVLAHTHQGRMQKLTAIGVPIASTKLKVVDPTTGEVMSMGKQGEIAALGPQVMKGYLDRPDENRQIFDSEGWLKTGDIGYFDEDGDFFIVERLKDLIKVKGIQVAPAEIESVLALHPKIREVAVVGVPDDKSGEVPRAFVVLQTGSEMTETEVQDFLKPKLSAYKQLLGGVRFVKELPKNNVGKVLRRKLRVLD